MSLAEGSENALAFHRGVQDLLDDEWLAKVIALARHPLREEIAFPRIVPFRRDRGWFPRAAERAIAGASNVAFRSALETDERAVAMDRPIDQVSRWSLRRRFRIEVGEDAHHQGEKNLVR